ncbi:MAG: beta-galactosidase trimerization domain-containing protein [Clostridia bacterium]|nr:beta-galactosidase trimerization domain-containing protein [Clostridia bacterium]
MANLPYRQVHLDFHTSEHMPSVGSRFSKANFIEALKVGHINSITVFSKCHHGWAYHPTKVNRQHPGLEFDLLGAQLDACREAGVRAEVYLSAGFDEKFAREHTECLRTNKDGWRGSFLKAGYHRLCFGTPYLDQLCAEVEEVLQVYGDKFDGLFLDIVGIQPCYCQYCLDGMRKMGLDPEKDADARAYAKHIYLRYTDRIAALAAKYRPGMPIIHNDGGAIFQGRDIASCNTGHLELESLPTGGWGYDHFPRAAAYARTLGKEFLGMTGKFHRSWGEFGGYKHPNALRYEAALANACGARCSVGDQLHPDGEADISTYRMIGHAYEAVEAREPWLVDAVNVADVGLIAGETCKLPYADGKYQQDIGANRMMLETHYLYDVIDFEADLSAYRMLVLPDNITIDADRRAKLDAYLAQGGKLLLTGKSGTDETGAFAFDFGVTFGGAGQYKPAYLRPDFFLWPNGRTDYVMYETNYDAVPTEAFSGQILAERVDPYFNRSAEHFCSHRHTPYDRNKSAPAVFATEQIAYIAWDIFAEYAEEGAIHLRSLFKAVADMLLTGEGMSLNTDLPSCGVTSLWRQGERLVHHLVYAIPKRRGNGIEVIEDLPTVHNIMSVVRVPKAPTRVYLAPEGTELPFEYAGGCVSYTLPELTCSALVVIE